VSAAVHAAFGCSEDDGGGSGDVAGGGEQEQEQERLGRPWRLLQRRLLPAFEALAEAGALEEAADAAAAAEQARATEQAQPGAVQAVAAAAAPPPPLQPVSRAAPLRLGAKDKPTAPKGLLSLQSITRLQAACEVLVC
jgi:hypothetical protein